MRPALLPSQHGLAARAKRLRKLKRRERFSLLLLEEGEQYLDDYSASYGPEWNKTDSGGRLKVCTNSVVFEPNDIPEPILRLPLGHVQDVILLKSGSPVHNVGSKSELLRSNDRSEIYSIQIVSTQAIRCKPSGSDVPYIYDKQKARHCFRLHHAPTLQVFAYVFQLKKICSLPPAERSSLIRQLLEKRHAITPFDSSWIENFTEHEEFQTSAYRVTPLVTHWGRLYITNERLYFQPLNNDKSRPVYRYAFENLVCVEHRRHAMRKVGIEIFFEDNKCILLALQSQEERDRLYEFIVEKTGYTPTPLSEITSQWQRKELSNFDYLLEVNRRAGRTFNDLTQYPVFPWVLQDYSSEELDLTKYSTFRNLSRPIGALNPSRLMYLKQRYNEMPQTPEMPKFLYGTHYSTPGYVLYFLVRQAPEYMLRLQAGRFDAPDRLFNSVPDTWNSVLNDTQDVKELIPEFYDEGSSDFLINTQDLQLGVRQNGSMVGDVELPPWARGDPKLFVRNMREALECDHVSSQLPRWIDLIFGCKQTGQAAVDANNVFYHLTYEGAVDVDAMEDENQRRAIVAQISEFGQTPTQLFLTAHPDRPDAVPLIPDVMDEPLPSAPGDTANNKEGGSGFSLAKKLSPRAVSPKLQEASKSLQGLVATVGNFFRESSGSGRALGVPDETPAGAASAAPREMPENK
eukprot:Rmarinus@m.6464